MKVERALLLVALAGLLSGSVCRSDATDEMWRRDAAPGAEETRRKLLDGSEPRSPASAPVDRYAAAPTPRRRGSTVTATVGTAGPAPIGVGVVALVQWPVNVASMGPWDVFWYTLGGSSFFVCLGGLVGLFVDWQLHKAQQQEKK